MARLPADVLERSPEEAARLIALSFLKEAGEARHRLTNSQDGEALHDFRVAIRRLRSCLRAFRPHVRKSLPKKLQRALRDLTTTTNGARDAEVMLALVRELSAGVDQGEQGHIDTLERRLEERKSEALGRVQVEVLAPFDDLSPQLQKRLSRFETIVHLDRRARHDPFGRAVGDRIRRETGNLRDRLAFVHDRRDVEESHRARIAAKRLRYLLEPLTRRRKRAIGLVESLKSLQDLLGEIHDLQVLADEITAAVAEAAAIEARRAHSAAVAPEAGEHATLAIAEPTDLVGLARRVEGRLAVRFAQLDREWLAGRAEPLLARLERFGDGLAVRRAKNVEIERKFLLTGLPPLARDVVPQEIDQGWIAGQVVNERVRRTRVPGADTYSRTIKLGEGVARSEFEEAMTLDAFETLWPLTEHRRISKRRYPVPDGERIWEIDEFLDRELVLAEVELDAEGEDVTPPDWLKPFVVREVTGESEYVNVNLAK